MSRGWCHDDNATAGPGKRACCTTTCHAPIMVSAHRSDIRQLDDVDATSATLRRRGRSIWPPLCRSGRFTAQAALVGVAVFYVFNRACPRRDAGVVLPTLSRRRPSCNVRTHRKTAVQLTDKIERSKACRLAKLPVRKAKRTGSFDPNNGRRPRAAPQVRRPSSASASLQVDRRLRVETVRSTSALRTPPSIAEGRA